MKDRFRALAVLIAIFLVGILTGAAGSYFWLKPPADAGNPSGEMLPPPLPKSPPRPEFPELDLTPKQKEQFGEIMEETRGKMDNMMEVLRKEQRAALDNKRDSILAEHNRKVSSILNEEQRVKFNNFVTEWNEWLKKAPRHARPEPPKENRRKPERPQSKPPE